MSQNLIEEIRSHAGLEPKENLTEAEMDASTWRKVDQAMHRLARNVNTLGDFVKRRQALNVFNRVSQVSMYVNRIAGLAGGKPMSVTTTREDVDTELEEGLTQDDNLILSDNKLDQLSAAAAVAVKRKLIKAYGTGWAKKGDWSKPMSQRIRAMFTKAILAYLAEKGLTVEK